MKYGTSKMMILREKHDSRYIDVTSDDDAIFVALVKERYNDGVYRDIQGFLQQPDPEPLEPFYTGPDPEKLYEERDRARQTAYNRRIRFLKERRLDEELLNKALAGDGKAARKLLNLRRDYQYEGLEFVTLEVLI